MTLDIPDELVSRLRPRAGELSQILELGLRELSAMNEEGFRSVSEVLEKLAALPAPQEVLALRPSESLQARVSELLEKNRGAGLSAAEQREWESYQYLEHLVRMAKAQATQRLQGS